MRAWPGPLRRRRVDAKAASTRGILLGVAVLAAAVFTLLLPASGNAVHGLGLLELDTSAPQFANTADNSGPGAPYDWESIFNASGVQTLTSAMEPRLRTADFSADYVKPDASYFATSNKDIDDVSTWQCGSVNNPTPKDEISNAYAALFVDPTDNHAILYAGAERDKNNGESFVGFWIFKSNVNCQSPGTFTGAHTNGDVLVLSNFTGGGSHPLVEVYEWDNGALSLLASGNFCHSSNSSDDVCGEVNGTPFNTIWAPHDSAANPLDTNEFLEVGVDLNDVLDIGTGSVPCFARFQAETRSSQETTATLKDYAGGQFNTCNSSTVTTPLAGGSSVSGQSVIPGTSVTDRAVVTGSAAVGTAPTPTGSVSFFLCGPQATQAAAQCSTGGTPVGSAVSLSGSGNQATATSEATKPTAPGWYCFRAEYSGDSNYPSSKDSSLQECFQVVKLNPTVSTFIHDAAHATVTTIAAGSTVHDFISVTGAAGTPTGNVTLDWFTNGTCAGSSESTSGNLALNASGQVDATSFAKGPLAAGLYGFRANYAGDTVYNPGTGDCEPLRVVDARIQISPDGVNRVGQTHTFTGHAEVNDGTGWVNAPAGTQISFTKTGPGAFTSPNPCTTSGGTGSCTIDLTSATTGVTSVSGSTSVSVAGVALNRTTNGAGGNSGPATKRWVDAKIAIAPSATNRVGQSHTFTVTLMKDTGNGAGFQPAAGEHVSFSLLNSDGANAVLDAAASTCDDAGPNTDANGRCTIVFTSSATGHVTGHAAAVLSVAGSAPFSVATDGQGDNSEDAVKTFVDARIHISPSATNEVGQDHTFTVLVEKDLGGAAGWVPAANEPVTVTLSNANGASFDVSGNSCTAGTNVNGVCTITFTSSAPGTVTGHASSTLSDLGTAGPITVETTGQGENGSNAVKTFVDAYITISPPSAANPINTTHTYTAHVFVNDGSGAGYVDAPNGTVVSFAFVGAHAGSFEAGNTCTISNGNGTCTVDTTASMPGNDVMSASTTLSVGGVSMTRTTGEAAPGHANSDNANKNWGGLKITIAPSATNEVGQPHTFTVTLSRDTGSGFAPLQGEHVDVTLTDSAGASHTAPTGTCTNSGGNTDADGRCTVTFTSSTAGKVTGNATATVDVGGQQIKVSTDGVAPNSGDAVKTFVDAYMTISPPSAANPINTTHTYTAHVFVNDGSGAGYVDAPNGTVVSFAFVDAHVGSFVAGSQCTVSNGNGTCTVDTTSAKAGNDTMSASTTLSVGGVVLTRTTGQAAPGHANGDNAAKNWVGAKITIAPSATNEVGQPHTFTVTLSRDTGSGFQPLQGEHVDVTLTDDHGAKHTDATGSCTAAGANTDANGQCTVTFSSPTTGTVTGHATATVDVGGKSVTVSTDGTGDNSANAVKTFVDASIQIGPPSATNEVGANHTFTVTVKKDSGDGNGLVAAQGVKVTTTIANANGATASVKGGTCTSGTTNATGQCTLVISSPTAGTTSASASATLSVGGVSLTRDTDPATASVGAGPGGSGPAAKTWADANIQITPATAGNPVGTTHTLTGHVNVNAGSSTFSNAPAGTAISFTIVSGPGSFVGGLSSCTTGGATGSCTVQITSAVTGTTVVRASTDVGVGGLTLHRATADAKAGDSADAAKSWGDDTVRTDILNATGGVVTSVVAGTVVHDKVFVQRTSATPASVPNPTGNVIFHRYTTGDCTGTSTDQTVALTQGDPSTAITADFAPTAGSMSYKADYLGDANYPARSGACEPLTVTPVPAPAIAIVKNPKGQTVASGGRARFQITVTNVGNTELTNVTVTDPRSPNCNRTSAQIPALASMAPNASVTYSCSRPNVRRAFDNIATATGTPPAGPKVTASDAAPVKVRALKPPKPKPVKKKQPKVVSHQKPKTTG